MSRYISEFLYILSGKKAQLAWIVVLFLINGVLDVVSIGLVGPFMAIATNPDVIDENQLLRSTYAFLNLQSPVQFVGLIGFAVLIAFYAKSILYFSIQRYIFQFGYTQMTTLQARLLHAYLSVPYTFHLKRNSASLIQNIVQETTSYCNSIMVPLLNLVASLIVLIFLLVLLIRTDPIATVTIAGILFFTFLPYHHFRGKLREWGTQTSQAGERIYRAIHHGLGGLKEARVIGCEDYFEADLKQHVQLHADAATSYSTFKILPRLLVESLLITFLIVLACIFLFTNNRENLTSVLAVFAMASIRLLPVVSNLSSSLGSLRFNTYTLHKLYFDLKELEKYEVQYGSKLVKNVGLANASNLRYLNDQVASFTDEIVLDQIEYRYPESANLVLKNISLTIKKGQSIALIGRSGSGKTTLVDVILGLLQPENGDITVDGMSIYSDLRSWQNLIGYIPQTIFLMDDTIERNIAFGVPDELIDPKRLDKAIRASQLSDLINQLPEGLKTRIGERGVCLSGGQRQRIGIARALYHEREILVLDEATAALDNETEALVTESIKALSGIKTMIIIAHRLSTVEHCDRVYQMEQGKIVRSGTYREVVLEETSTLN